MQATLYTILTQKFRFQINHNLWYNKKYKSANKSKDTKNSNQKAH